MNDKEKNIIDKFLDSYEKNNVEKKYVRVIVKPSKGKAIFGFIVSLILLIVLLTLFSLTFMYFLFLIGDLLIVIYYGINVFTEKGIGLPKTVEVPYLSEEKGNGDDFEHRNRY